MSSMSCKRSLSEMPAKTAFTLASVLVSSLRRPTAIAVSALDVVKPLPSSKVIILKSLFAFSAEIASGRSET